MAWAPGAELWQCRALTCPAALPRVAHGARAHKVPAEVLAGRTILTGAQEAGRWHWEEQKAPVWTSRAQSSCHFPPSHVPEAVWMAGKEVTSSSTRTYRSRRAVQHSPGRNHTCTCRCSGSRCPHSGRAPRHRGPVYLWAAEVESGAGRTPPTSPRHAGAVPISQWRPVKR